MGSGSTSCQPARSQRRRRAGYPASTTPRGCGGGQAPLGSDVRDPSPVTEAIVFLLSEMSRAISGEIVHVDGGFHAMGAPLAERQASTADAPS
jgi:hypothetical protein